jgi:hypothetical protein
MLRVNFPLIGNHYLGMQTVVHEDALITFKKDPNLTSGTNVWVKRLIDGATATIFKLKTHSLPPVTAYGNARVMTILPVLLTILSALKAILSVRQILPVKGLLNSVCRFLNVQTLIVMNYGAKENVIILVTGRV